MDEIIGLYNNMGGTDKRKFNSSIESKLNVSKKVNQGTYDDTWLSKMEDTIRYLDNILRNPNRFIINEEEIVKIELARRITVDSIKHLSKNTNLISKFDPKTDEIKPSKILNINKEESFNTYENRFIYTLINNMKMYIDRKKAETIEDNFKKQEVKFDYSASATIDKEKVNITIQMNEDLDDKNTKQNDITARIKKLEDRITDLCSTTTYKDIARLHVSPVVSPIKKTNLILKNVNFQYALDLWNYMQSHMDPSSKTENIDKNYEDKGRLRKMMNDSFMLNYLIMKSMDNEDTLPKEELQNKIAANTINQLLNLSENLTAEEIMKLIGDEYAKVKYKKVLNTSEVAKKYREAIELYVAKEHKLDDEKEDENEQNTGQ